MRRRIQRLLRRLLAVMVIVLAIFFMLRSKYRLVIDDLAQTQVKNTTSDLTNDAIAKQIASRHNVGITVSSVEGGETTFGFVFPPKM